MLYTKLKHKTREIKELTSLGLINPTWIRNMEIFEQFHYYLSNGNDKSSSYVLCSDDFGINWESVKKIVSNLSK